MLKEVMEKATKKVLFHTSVLLRGIVQVINGAITAAAIAYAVYGFLLVRGEDGYAAVGDFAACFAVLTIALVNAYALGNKKRGKRK